MNKPTDRMVCILTGAVSAVSLARMYAGFKTYNIVYIMTDDHTAQMMSCYDNRYIETPNQIASPTTVCALSIVLLPTL